MPRLGLITIRLGRQDGEGLTFLQQDAFQQRVLVAEHEAFVGRTAMTLLQALERFLIALDGGLELADVFRPSFAEGGLGLAIALLALL